MDLETDMYGADVSLGNRHGHIVTLSENSLLRYFVFAALYMAQGLPPGLMTIAFPAWLVEQGLGTAEIGSFLAVVSLPWSLKIVAGPLMDRFGFLSMGRRRPWVLGAQCGLLVSLVFMATVSDPVKDLDRITIIGLFVCLCVAFQDVAVDGMAIDVIPINERARANGFMWGSKTLGVAIAASGGGVVLSTFGLKTALFLVTGLVGLITFAPLLFCERPGERLLPWTQGEASDIAAQLQLHDWRCIFRGLLRAVLTPTSLITVLAAFLFMLVFGLLQAVLPVLCVQELGWNHTEYSHVWGVAGIIGCMVGMVLSTTIINRWGEIRTLVIITIFVFILDSVVGVLSSVWPAKTVIVSFVIIVSVLKFSGTVAILAMFMNMCSRRVAATQFTMYMALVSLGSSAGAALTGPMDAIFDYSHIFFIMAAFSILVLVLLRFVGLKAHQKHLKSLEQTKT